MLNPLSLLGGYLWYAILSLALALGGSLYLLKASYERNGRLSADLNAATDALEAAQEQRALDRATLARLAVKKAARARESASAAASLGAALTANRQWADTPVPQGVQDALK
jgi:hypothetical protein